MTILEELREKKKRLMDYEVSDKAWELLKSYDTQLEISLLKLRNRAVEIKDLKHRLKESETLSLERLHKI
jgi:hypothetical protein